MDNIKQARTMINKELFLTKFLHILFGFFGLFMIVAGIRFSFALVFLGIIYYGLVYLALSTRRETANAMKNIRRYLSVDVDKALSLLESEVRFLNDTVNAPKSEMDIHSVNATNEGKAMRASRRNAIALGKRLTKFTRMRDLVRDNVRSLNKKEVTPWDE